MKYLPLAALLLFAPPAMAQQQQPDILVLNPQVLSYIDTIPHGIASNLLTIAHQQTAELRKQQESSSKAQPTAPENSPKAD